tara:strand:- start:953 stop:1603 length:651 start_codon:yes stop_codon:yes gene_type:complete
VKWLKLYVDIAQNPRIKLLSFEDRWHYISLLCAKAEGYLDENPALRERMISVHLGLTLPEMENVKERLVDVGLIGSNWTIYNWDEKQSKDATGAARKRRQRAREKAEADANKEVRNKKENETVTVTSRDSHATPIKQAGSRFKKPSIEELNEYIVSKGYPVSAQEFMDFYDANGWKVGKNPMKDWKAAVRTWANRRRQDSTGGNKGPETDAGVVTA